MKKILLALLTLSALAFAACTGKTVVQNAQEPAVYKGKYFNFHIFPRKEMGYSVCPEEENIPGQPRMACRRFNTEPKYENVPGRAFINKEGLSTDFKVTEKQDGVVRKDNLWISLAICPKCTPVHWDTSFDFGDNNFSVHVSGEEMSFHFYTPNAAVTIAPDPDGRGALCYGGAEPALITQPDDGSWVWPVIVPWLFEKCAEKTGVNIALSTEEKNILSRRLVLTTEHAELKRVLKYAKQINVENVQDPKTVNAITNIFNSIGKIRNGRK